MSKKNKRAALVYLPLDTELAKSLKVYRDKRRVERGGKVMGNSAAIRELLRTIVIFNFISVR